MSKTTSSKKESSPKQREELIRTLQTRFENAGVSGTGAAAVQPITLLRLKTLD